MSHLQLGERRKSLQGHRHSGNSGNKLVELGGTGQRAAQRAARRWLVVAQDGATSLFASPKLDISAWTGVQLQLRDLRLLDPLLATSYPSAILTRNGAIVANLESVKLLVTTEKAFITNLEDDLVSEFATELCRRLVTAARARQLEELARQQAEAAAAAAASANPLEPVQAALGGVGGGGAGVEAGAVGQLQLPFELQVLEVALEMVCARLEKQAADLEAEANPVLDSMARDVTQASLENERRVKNKLVRLATRVETLKEVLEKLLDDEDDMVQLNLSAVAAERLAAAQRRASFLEGRSGDATPAHYMLSSRELAGVGGMPGSLGRTGAWVAAAAGSGPGPGGWELAGSGQASASRTPARADSLASSASSSEWEDAAVEVVEALLQSFFFSVDAMHDRLRQLQEYVEDTEDLVAMELDNARNSLVRLDMVLTCVNASMSFVIALGAIFAVNLQQGADWEESGETQGPYWEFVTICVVSGLGAILIFVGVMVFARLRRLI